jgi:hypothetical protein
MNRKIYLTGGLLAVSIALGTMLVNGNNRHQSDPGTILEPSIRESLPLTSQVKSLIQNMSGSFSPQPNNSYIFKRNQFTWRGLTRTTATPTEFIHHSISTDVPSMRQIAITENNPPLVTVNGIVLLHDIVINMSKTGWGKDGSYKSNTRLPIADMGLSMDQLNRIIEIEKIKDQEQYPSPELTYLFSSPGESAYIEKLIITAYNEYLNYLRTKGVNRKYTDIMTGRIVPANPARLMYKADEYVESSYTHPWQKQPLIGEEPDSSQRETVITAGSVYNDFQYLITSRIFGEIPQGTDALDKYLKTIRDMAVRNGVYHEATHILQHGYMYLYTPPEDQNSKVLYVTARRSLADLDQSTAWKWGKYENSLRGTDVARSQERQANGIAFEVLTNIYDMSDRQRQIIWDYLLASLDPNRKLMLEIKSVFENQWTDMANKNGINSDLALMSFNDWPGSAEEKLLLKKLVRNISINSYAGYFDPMRPDEAGKFWETLKN